MVTKIIAFASLFSAMIPLVIYHKHWNSNKLKPIRVVYLSIIVSLLTDIVSVILFELKIPNHIIGNIAAMIIYVLTLFFYVNIMFEKTEWLYSFIVIYFGFVFINTVLFQSLFEYQGYTRAFGGILLIVCAVMYCNKLLITLPTTNILTYGFFWINTAIIFYYSFSLFLFIFSNYVFNNLPIEKRWIFWTFHNLDNIVKNCIFCLGIYYSAKISKS